MPVDVILQSRTLSENLDVRAVAPSLPVHDLEALAPLLPDVDAQQPAVVLRLANGRQRVRIQDLQLARDFDEIVKVPPVEVSWPLTC